MVHNVTFWVPPPSLSFFFFPPGPFTRFFVLFRSALPVLLKEISLAVHGTSEFAWTQFGVPLFLSSPRYRQHFRNPPPAEISCKTFSPSALFFRSQHATVSNLKSIEFFLGSPPSTTLCPFFFISSFKLQSRLLSFGPFLPSHPLPFKPSAWACFRTPLRNRRCLRRLAGTL